MSFDNFIYVKVAGFVYLILLLLIGLVNTVLVLYLVVAIAADNLGIEFLLLIPASFIASMLLIIIARLSLESGVALIKIAENTKK